MDKNKMSSGPPAFFLPSRNTTKEKANKQWKLPDGSPTNSHWTLSHKGKGEQHQRKPFNGFIFLRNSSLKQVLETDESPSLFPTNLSCQSGSVWGPQFMYPSNEEACWVISNKPIHSNIAWPLSASVIRWIHWIHLVFIIWLALWATWHHLIMRVHNLFTKIVYIYLYLMPQKVRYRIKNPFWKSNVLITITIYLSFSVKL